MSVIAISDQKIGAEHMPFVIAEIGQAHDGSLGTAHAYIDAVSRAGVNAVKFQTHIAAAESTVHEKFRVKGFPQDRTRYEYWKRMEFTLDEWAGLVSHAEDEGLVFLSSPFSMEAVDLLESLDIPAWKIGSGEVTNLPMLEKIALTGKPILLSSGMSPWSEIDEAVSFIEESGTAGYAVFQCTSSYPVRPEEAGLNILAELTERYDCPIGFSDHSGAVFSSLAAVTLGASIIEVHTVFSKDCFGPDVSSSLTLEELSVLTKGAQQIKTSLLNPVDKDKLAEKYHELRQLFGKSIVAAHDLEVGHILTKQDLRLKKPGTGVPAKKINALIGKKLNKKYREDELIDESDCE